MRHFESCEGCGRSDLLTMGGLCFACNQVADRAALGRKPVRRIPVEVHHDDGRIRTVLAQTPRPLPEVTDAP